MELILFLALSGLVFLIGFSGISGRNREVQFSDSIRTLDAYLQGHLNDVFNGVNNDAIAVDNTGDEVLLGKYFAFCTETNSDAQCSGSDGARVLVYDVVGDKLSRSIIADITSGAATCPGLPPGPLATNDVDAQLLDCSRPRIVGDPEVESIDWGTQFLSGNAGVRNYAAAGFAMLRSPNSTRVVNIVHWTDSSTAGSPPSDNDFLDAAENMNDMFYSGANGYDPSGSMQFCFQSPDEKYSAVIVGLAERQTSFELEFDPRYTPDNPRPGQLPNTCGRW